MLDLSAANARFLAFLGAMLLFLLLLSLSLLAPIYSGLLTYALVTALSQRLMPSVQRSRLATMYAAWIVGGVVVIVLIVAGLGIHSQIRNGLGFQMIMVEMSKILSSARDWLPASIGNWIPEKNEVLQAAGDWLREHATQIGVAGFGTLKIFGYIIIGILLGAMIGVAEVTRTEPLGPVSEQLVSQVIALRSAFWQVATAQLKISLLNTLLTSIYLLIALPLAGVHLPFTKTLLIVTFVAGLLPVLGNLISNTVIVVISLSASWAVAVASLMFLIGVHKLEYFANARIVGTEIKAKAWEVLVCMLVMERILGFTGVIAGPVFYAWLKSEWHRWDQPRSSVIATGEGASG